MQIIQAVCLVVSGLPAEQRRAGLTALMGPILEQLQAALQGRPLSANGAPNGASSALSHAQPNASMDLILVERLTTLFRSEPVLVFLNLGEQPHQTMFLQLCVLTQFSVCSAKYACYKELVISLAFEEYS